jgi:hypothetical protein
MFPCILSLSSFALKGGSRENPRVPHIPISCGISWVRELHAPFLNERRTRGRVQGSVQEIRGISHVLCARCGCEAEVGEKIRGSAVERSAAFRVPKQRESACELGGSARCPPIDAGQHRPKTSLHPSLRSTSASRCPRYSACAACPAVGSACRLCSW